MNKKTLQNLKYANDRLDLFSQVLLEKQKQFNNYNF